MDVWMGSGVVTVGWEDGVHVCTAPVAALELSDKNPWAPQLVGGRIPSVHGVKDAVHLG